MDKKIYFSISEVVDLLNENDLINSYTSSAKDLNADSLKVQQSTLRFWEDEFNLNIKRSKNVCHSTRQYTQEDIVELKDIRYALRVEKVTIEGLKNQRKNGKNVNKRRNITEILTGLMQELVEIRKNLNDLPIVA